MPEIEMRTIELPADLHPDTQQLVVRFAEAMGQKLRKAEIKHGYSDHWKDPRNTEGLQESMAEHLAKGDPVDIGNYCAFLWHLGASTEPVVHGKLDFEPDAQHAVADMANCGRSLMQAIADLRPDYCWNNSPAEIVCDLINEIEEIRSSAALRLLLDFARSAYIAFEDGGAQVDDEGSVKCDAQFMVAVNESLEALAELPEVPDYVACPIAKARFHITGEVNK